MNLKKNTRKILFIVGSFSPLLVSHYFNINGLDLITLAIWYIIFAVVFVLYVAMYGMYKWSIREYKMILSVIGDDENQKQKLYDDMGFKEDANFFEFITSDNDHSHIDIDNLVRDYPIDFMFGIFVFLLFSIHGYTTTSFIYLSLVIINFVFLYYLSKYTYNKRIS